MSELALELIREAKNKKLTKLSLKHCELTKIPKEIIDLVDLEELIIINTKIRSIQNLKI